MAQLTCAARAAHSAGLLLQPQSLAPSKVILTSPRRIRVGTSMRAHTLALMLPGVPQSCVQWQALHSGCRSQGM